jgi:hypothetical protein
MILNIHSNASYLLEANTRSCTCGHFFMGWMPQDGKPICLSGAFHVSKTILRFVGASAAKAELGALYHNCQIGIIFQFTLTEMGHHNQNPPYIATMPQRWASQTIQSNDISRNQWK